MISAIYSAIGGESVKHHAARLFTGATVFWLAGAAVVLWHRNVAVLRDQGFPKALTTLTSPLQGLPPVAAGTALLGALTVIVGSALVAEKLTLSVLRLLEGYWRRPALLRALRVRYWWTARERAMRTYQSIQTRRASKAAVSDDDEVALTRAASVLREIPPTQALVMPTRLGNLLRVAELRPLHNHGVDAIACWPHLWLVLPEDTRTEVATARGELDAAVRGWFWAALFVVWTPWAWWAAVLALLTAALAYAGCVRAAATYAILVVSAFDVHLPLLYQATRLATPSSAAEQLACGDRLSRYLRDGSDDPDLLFVPMKER